MVNFIRKFWWVLLAVLMLLPIGLNYILHVNIGANIIGEPKDWLYFWGSYISSIASLWMIILTYLILKQNDETRRGIIVTRVIYHKTIYCLEISNVGNSIAYDIEISTNTEFNDILNELSRYYFTKFQNKKFSLRPNENKYIMIGSAIEGSYRLLNPETNQQESINNTKEYLNTLKNASMKINGTYKSIGKEYRIVDSFCINDYDLNFIMVSTTIDKELPKITNELSKITNEINELKQKNDKID